MTWPPIDTMHVIPAGDLIQHEATEDCPCGPSPTPSFREDGSNGWVVVHHSLDGRESTEANEIEEPKP